MGQHKKKNPVIKPVKAKEKVSFTAVLIVITVIVIVGLDMSKRADKSPFQKYDAGRVKGNPQAPLQIIEFVDFQCRDCKKASDLVGRYVKEYPDGIFLQVRYYPLGALNSMVSAKYAQCAGEQGKFFEYHNALFDNQDVWRNLLKVHKELDTYAQDIGLNADTLKACVEDAKTEKIIKKDRLLGESQSVKSTPTFFVNGQMYVGSASLEMVLKEFFDKPTQDLL